MLSVLTIVYRVDKPTRDVVDRAGDGPGNSKQGAGYRDPGTVDRVQGPGNGKQGAGFRVQGR